MIPIKQYLKSENYIFVLYVVIIIWLIYKFLNIQFRKKYSTHERLKLMNRNAGAMGMNKNVENLLIISASIPEEQKTALDNFNTGNLYLYNVQDAENAHEHYARSLNKIIAEPATNLQQKEDNIFILNRIEDFTHIQPDFFNDIDFDDIRRMIVDAGGGFGNNVEFGNNDRTVVISNNNIPAANPNINVQIWRHDSQNVHDGKINDMLQDHYEKIKEKISNPQSYTPESIKNLINELDLNRTTKYNAIKVVETIARRNTFISKLNAGEFDVLCRSLDYINSEEFNSEEKSQLYNSLVTSLSNCNETIDLFDWGLDGTMATNRNDTNVVCGSGVVANIISSFAHIAKNDIGILKTRESIRNEIFHNAGQIMKKYTDENMNIPIGDEDNINAEIKEMLRDYLSRNLITKGEYETLLIETEL
jgi:hypothetical protein